MENNYTWYTLYGRHPGRVPPLMHNTLCAFQQLPSNADRMLNCLHAFLHKYSIYYYVYVLLSVTIDENKNKKGTKHACTAVKREVFLQLEGMARPMLYYRHAW